jgi:hypothetical protein
MLESRRTMMNRTLWTKALRLALLGLTLAGCRSGVVNLKAPADASVCAEHRDLTCLSGQPICSMDRERGCKECRCPVPYGTDPASTPTERGVPTDRPTRD